MACSMPLAGWYSNELNESGKRGVVFNPRKAFLDMPLELPCGKCEGCRADQSLAWSIRAYHEATQHEKNCFITLTYSDAHLPDDGAIDKRALQLFFKRLRKRIAPEKLRYFACGEYGEKTGRPHYHAIIFGLDFLDARRTMLNSTLYTHPVLETTWGLGQVAIDSVNFRSICYTCGYVTKKISDPDTFSLMSRRPGIGHDWLNKYSDDIKRTGACIIEGREFLVPPRYLRWNEKEFQELLTARKNHAKLKSQQYDPVERRKRSDAKATNRRARINQKAEKL